MTKTKRRPLSRRGKAGLLAGAAVAVAATLLAVPAANAGFVPPEGPVGSEQPSPTVQPSAPDFSSLADLIAYFGVNRDCPPAGPASPAQGTGSTTPTSGQRTVRIAITGDSYMSGEGAGDYYNARGVIPPPRVLGPGDVLVPPPGYTEADYAEDFRHRSANAAVMLAVEALRQKNPNVLFDVDFNASSGAETKNYYVTQNDNGRTNPPQREGIDANADLVIVGFGGNDIGFGPLVQQAMTGHDRTTLQNLAQPGLNLLALREDWEEWSDARLDKLDDPNYVPSSLVSRYIRMVADIHRRAPEARVMMVSYPQGLGNGSGEFGSLMDRLLQPHERGLLRSLAPQLTTAMMRAQRIMSSHGIQADLLNVSGVFDGHEIGTDDPYVNDLTIRPVVGGVFNQVQETAHPNRRGTQLLATYYAQMMAAELGVYAPKRGTLWPGGPANPCLPGLLDSVPGGGSASGSSSSGGSSGGGGGGSSGGGYPSDGGLNGGYSTGGSGTDGGTAGDIGGLGDGGLGDIGGGDGGTGGTGNTGGSAGWGDIDPVTPVQPTDPEIPDGINPPEYPPIPIPDPPPVPDGDPGEGGGPPPLYPPVLNVIVTPHLG